MLSLVTCVCVDGHLLALPHECSHVDSLTGCFGVCSGSAIYWLCRKRIGMSVDSLVVFWEVWRCLLRISHKSVLVFVNWMLVVGIRGDAFEDLPQQCSHVD